MHNAAIFREIESRATQTAPLNESLVVSVSKQIAMLEREISIYESMLSANTEATQILSLKKACLFEHARWLKLLLQCLVESRFSILKDQSRRGSFFIDHNVLNKFEIHFFNAVRSCSDYYFNCTALSLSIKNAARQPPKELFVKVRVAKDCGSIQTERGPIRLSIHSCHFIRRSYVENLIMQGFVTIVK